MKTSELIEFLKTQPFTKDQAYNLIINDISLAVTDDELARPEAQKLVAYFMYKIQEILLPVIEQLKEKDARYATLWPTVLKFIATTPGSKQNKELMEVVGEMPTLLPK